MARARNPEGRPSLTVYFNRLHENYSVAPMKMRPDRVRIKPFSSAECGSGARFDF